VTDDLDFTYLWQRGQGLYVGSVTEAQPNCAATPIRTTAATSLATEVAIKLTTFRYPERTLGAGPIPTESWPSNRLDTGQVCSSDDSYGTASMTLPELTSADSSVPAQTGSQKSASNKTFAPLNSLVCASVTIALFLSMSNTFF
jgi:hypothetical protein